jgi:hypothetical protein
MGGTIAIVSPQWVSWVNSNHTTDPMGMGAINSIDIKVGDKVLRSINVYLILTTATIGKATMHSRVTSYQYRSTSEPWIKRLSSIDFMLHLTQLLVSKAQKRGYMVIVQGDFNRPLTNLATPTLLDDWVSQNKLLTPGFSLLY